jgi:hypothetical protein
MTATGIKEQLAANCIPPGYLYSIVSISHTKRALAGEMPLQERLAMLQGLETEPTFTPEQIAAVEPMCDKALEITGEAMKLGDGAELDVFARHFETFAVLNPSLMTALQMSPAYRMRAEHTAQMGAPV